MSITWLHSCHDLALLPRCCAVNEPRHLFFSREDKPLSQRLVRRAAAGGLVAAAFAAMAAAVPAHATLPGVNGKITYMPNPYGAIDLLDPGTGAHSWFVDGSSGGGAW